MKKLLLCAVFGLLLAGIHSPRALADEPGGLAFTRLGGWTEGYCGAMAVDHRTVYLANGAWLEEIDVADPAAPRVRSRVELSAGIIDLERNCARICALTADGVLHVIRDRGGRGLQVEGRLDFESSRGLRIRGMTVVGPYVYVNDGRSLHIVDITGPGMPQVVRSLDYPLGRINLQSAVATGNALYLGTEGTTHIFDVSDPLQPVAVRELWGWGHRLAVDGGLLNINTPDCCSLFWDLADPLAPRRLDRWTWSELFIEAFAVHDTLLYADGPNLRVFTREGRGLSGSTVPAWNIDELDAQGDLLFARQEGLTVVGLTDPLDPVVVGRHRTGVEIRGLQFAGDRAYLAGGAGRLTVMDVADPDRPALLGAWDTPDERTDPRERVVSINGGRALVGGFGADATVLDVTDPAAIRPLSPRLTVFGHPVNYDWAIPAGDGWFVSGSPTPNRLSVAADGGATLAPVDLPAHPCEVRPGVYIGSRSKGDLTPGVWLAEDGGDPRRVADLVTGFEAQPLGWRYAASGDIAYGLGHQFYSPQPDSFTVRLVVAAFDLAEPQRPRILGTSFLPHDAARAIWGGRMIADGGLLYVFSQSYGEVAVLDARDPRNVVRCGALWIGSGIVDVAIARDRLVVATATGGFRTYERPVPTGGHVAAAPEPTTGLALRAAPNPFNPTTSVTFRMPLTGPAEVNVFDLRGRRVQRLYAGILAAGAHEFVWRGVDEAGRAVAAGTYVVRVSSDGGVRTAKLLLVK